MVSHKKKRTNPNLGGKGKNPVAASEQVSKRTGAMKVALLTALLVAIVLTFFWRESVNQRYLESAISDIVLSYQDEIDSLSYLAERLQEQRFTRNRFQGGGNNSQDSSFHHLQTEIEYMRRQSTYLYKEAIRATGNDSLNFYLSKLDDSLFVSHAGTFEFPVIWRIAAEELGAMGKTAVPHLIRTLDSENEYGKEQALYALLLASQHSNVTVVTRGDSPTIKGRIEYLKMTKIEAWKKWFDKYGAEWK